MAQAKPSSAKVQVIDTPDGPVDFPIDMSDDEIAAVLAQQFPPEKELSWKEAGEKADETFYQSAQEFGKRLKGDVPYSQTATDIGEGIVDVGGAILEDPWGSAKSFVGHVRKDFEDTLSNITGATVAQIPGAEEANVLLGGKPGLMGQRRRDVKKRYAEAPISTLMNAAAIPGAMYQIPRVAWKTAQAIGGGATAAKALRAGMSHEELKAAMSELGEDATALDVMSQADRDKFVNKYLRGLSSEELDPLREMYQERKARRPIRRQEAVETATGLPRGTLSDPTEYVASVKEDIGQTKNIYAQSAKEAHAADLEDLKAQRNEAYRKAYEEGPDIDINEFDEIISSPIFQEVTKEFPDISTSFEVTREGRGLNNLEFMDRAEQELTLMAEKLGPGTTKGRAAAELARAIRDKLGAMDLPDYHSALDLHARVAKTSPTAGPGLPEDVAASMNEDLQTAVARGKLVKANLDLPEDLSKWVSRADANAMIMQNSVEAEKIFEKTLKSIPKGRRGEFTTWFRKWGAGAGGAGAAAMWIAHTLGVSPTLLGTIATGATAVGAGKALLGAARRRTGRKAVKQLLGGPENMPEYLETEPFSWLDYINMGYPVAAGSVTGKEEHH